MDRKGTATRSRRWTGLLRSRHGIAALLGLATLALYGRVAGHDFLFYDDVLYVTENAHVRAGITWGNVAWAFTTLDGFNYHPLTWLSHMVDVELFGLEPGAHHLVNAVLHAANAAVLFLVLFRATGAAGRSLAVAALFAVHPLHVESVAWVAERKDVLSTLFGFLTLGAYVRYARAPSGKRYAAVPVCLALSLLSKPMWVTAPFLLLLLDLWPLRRVRVVRLADEPGAAPVVSIGAIIVEKLPLLALSALSSMLAIAAQGRGGATEALALPLDARVANAVVSYVQYVWKTLWPVGLSPFYPHAAGRSAAWEVAAAAGLLAALTALAVRSGRRLPWLAVGWLWFLGMLVPVIGIVQVGAQGRADRYTYAPLIGLFIVAAWGLERLAGSWRRGIPIRAAAVAAVLALSAVAWRQIAVWSDHVTLFRHAIAVTEDNAVARLSLSQGLAHEGAWIEALLHGREAVRLEPRNARARKNLGFVSYQVGLVDEAIAELRAAIAIDPRYAEAYQNLAFAYGRKGLTREAFEAMATERRIRAERSR